MLDICVRKNDFVYKIEDYKLVPSGEYIVWDLKLIAGIDYINEDSDLQGFVPADNFIESVQYETLIQFIMHEGLIACLKENDYEIVDNPMK